MTTDSPQRVAVVNPTGQIAGAETVLLRYVDAMVAENWEVVAVTPAGPLAVELGQRGLRVETITELRLPGGPRTLSTPRLVARWLSTLPTLRQATASCDLIVANSLLVLPPLKLARLTSRSLWLVHEVVQRGDRRKIAEWAAPGLTGAVAVSRAAAAFPTTLGISTPVVHNGARWPVEPAAGANGARPVVGVVATISDWKGHHVLLDAVAGLPEVDLEIVGGHSVKDTPYVNGLRERASQPDLHGRVRFLGHQADPLPVMRSWTLAVSPSVMPEAGPLAVLEAMSLGLPVVATNHGGAPELVGHAGLLVAPRDMGELREAIAELIGNSDLYHRCQSAGRNLVAEGLNTETSEHDFLDIIRTARHRPINA